MSEGIKPTSREEWEQYLRDNLPDGSNKCPKCDEKDAEILRLREENRKLREAVISERVSRFKHMYNLRTAPWKDPDAPRREAESELRAEGVIE